jgi:predicted lipoprotein
VRDGSAGISVIELAALRIDQGDRAAWAMGAEGSWTPDRLVEIIWMSGVGRSPAHIEAAFGSPEFF